MRMKIEGGTPCHSDAPLCQTCVRSTIIRGQKLDEEIVLCNGRGVRDTLRITFRVTTCSDYMDARQPSMGQLLENAWVLRRPAQGRPAGFVHARDLRDEELMEVAARCTTGNGD